MFEIISETFSRYDYVIISIGTAGDDDQQQCPEFSRQLATQNRVVIYNFDPNYMQDSVAEEHRVDVVRLKAAFPFHRRTDPCQILSENFCDLITRLLSQNKKIILLSCAIPVLPDAFIMAANQHLSSIDNSDLIVVGSYLKDFLTVVYNSLFLSKWHTNHLQNQRPLIDNTPQEHKEFWSCMTKKEDTYYGLGADEPARDLRFREIQTHFECLGKVVKTLKMLQLDDFRAVIPTTSSVPYPQMDVEVATRNRFPEPLPPPLDTPDTRHRAAVTTTIGTDRLSPDWLNVDHSDEVSSSLLLKILSHPVIKTVGVVLLLAGIAGIIVGTCGLAGASIEISLIVAKILLGVGCVVTVATGAGFFAGSRMSQDEPPALSPAMM